MKRLHTYSQHFLRRPAFIKELVGHSNIRKNDVVYDLGAGSGAISAVLSTRCKRVVAVEVEPGTLAVLKRNMKRYGNVDVVESDIMSVLFPSEPFKIFANIPFDVSSPLLRRIFEEPSGLKSAYLIVQKQFARKLLIDSDYFTGALGAMIAPWYTARIRRPLRKTDFWPHPNVDTVLLEIKPREEPLLPVEAKTKYKEMIEQSFHDPNYFTKLPLKEAGIAEGVKPSEVKTDNWIGLFKVSKISEQG